LTFDGTVTRVRGVGAERKLVQVVGLLEVTRRGVVQQRQRACGERARESERDRGGRESQIESERESEREGERESDRVRENQREMGRESQREPERDSEREGERESDRVRERVRNRG